MSNYNFKAALHNPPHLFIANTLYMLTASIYQSEYLIQAPQRKAEWREAFHKAAQIYGWQIIAWVVLHNHYHAIVQAPENSATLSKFTGSYHKYTARNWNDQDGLSERKVWWNYWDACIRSDLDYNNRLRYIFWNPVKYGLVENPEDYRFSNYKEFLQGEPDFIFTNMDEVSDVPEF